MAGLWERIKPTATLPRVSQHLLDASMTLYADGAFTSQQILDAINGTLGASPLAGAELTDLTAIRTQLDAKATATLKIIYALRMSAIGIAAEMGRVNEATWRSTLGIS